MSDTNKLVSREIANETVKKDWNVCNLQFWFHLWPAWVYWKKNVCLSFNKQIFAIKLTINGLLSFNRSEIFDTINNKNIKNKLKLV